MIISELMTKFMEKVEIVFKARIDISRLKWYNGDFQDIIFVNAMMFFLMIIITIMSPPMASVMIFLWKLINICIVIYLVKKFIIRCKIKCDVCNNSFRISSIQKTNIVSGRCVTSDAYMCNACYSLKLSRSLVYPFSGHSKEHYKVNNVDVCPDAIMVRQQLD